MKARIVEEPKVFKKLELIIEKKEEAEVLWALLNLSSNDTLEALVSYGEIPNREKLVEVSDKMFYTLDNQFTPEW